ncbi:MULTISPECIES: sensor histidine kinase [unclassified Alteromonas]|uniref:sensor histidine kinase n=1 Tax=unclassified Alteromonas TaxID=2614992 RepID=UPI000E6786D6|nr:HAMP domain-containing sensor histidine kinase [Alteromonas sp. RKMC-009]AYA66007.1 HAMP domain-containing histidine kinase [Alteromonas sp. RKMC-009]
MSQHAVQLSIRSLFLWMVMAIATASLLVSAGLSGYNQVNHYREAQREDVTIFIDLLAALFKDDLLKVQSDRDKRLLGNKLKNLAVSPDLLNVHIYQQDISGQLRMVANYTKEGETRTSSKESSVSNYFRPVYSNEIVEIARAIENEDASTAGYIYIQVSTHRLNEKIQQSILTSVTVIILMLVICFIVSLKMQKLITAPIQRLGDFLSKTSRQRDYSARAEPGNIRELAYLSESINVMLSRIQEYMQKQKMAEEQHRKLNASLEDMVSQRTNALKDANQELIQTLEKLHQFQRQIVQNEKMASLGDMVAGVAHEVNTPIGLGVTASTMMLDRLHIIQKEFESKTLKASTMARFLNESQENLNIIYRNLNRAAELISSFKQVAVDQSSESNRRFCFAQLVNEILLSLRPRLKKLHHDIRVDCDPTLSVETKAGPINQIIINLIMNSVIHGFEHIEHGEIDIIAEMMTPTKMKLIYKDNGKGISNDIRKRIFDPFVTTKRGQGGSGLGMHLVYNLVTQALNGTISITSEEGNGVEFIIIFPVESSETGNLPLKGE